MHTLTLKIRDLIPSVQTEDTVVCLRSDVVSVATKMQYNQVH
jgi:hypothetical protein